MRNILILFVFSIALLSCSSSDESYIEDKTTLNQYNDPYFIFESPKSEIIDIYGDSYVTSPNDFSLGYKMVYESDENGIVNYSFSLDNQESLYETEVLLHSGKENVDFIKEHLSSKYTFISESTNGGLYSGHYENDAVKIELNYLDGKYSGATLIYSNNIQL